MRGPLRSLAVVMGMAAWAGASLHAQTPVPSSPPAPVVITQGDAVVKRAPDQAWLSVTTESRDPKADEARRKGAEAMTAVQAAIRGAGVAADAVRTTGFVLTPDVEWNNGRSTIKGYIARNDIEVRVDAIDRVGAVIDAVNAARGTTVSVTGPRFALKDQASAEAEALRLAVTSALARAQAMATGAHRTLGVVLRIERQDNGGPIRPEPAFMRVAGVAPAAQAETPIVAGDIEVRAQVSVTIELR